MVTIVINPISGGASPSEAAERATVARSVLASAGEDGDVHVTECRGHGHDIAMSAARRGDRLVVAWGGDGTVNEVASALVNTTTALGIVRAGSGNGLARELKVPKRPEVALRSALHWPVRRIDGGQLGGRWFFVVAGIGFDAHVAHAFDRSGRKRRGLATYARLAGVELWRYRCGQYNVNGSPRANVLLVTFANGAQFGNGARIAPSARVDDGQLDMVTVEERSRLSTLLSAPRLFWGGLERVPGITVQRVSHAVVESPVPMAFHVDGEPMQGSTRLEARVHPAVLWVASPARPDALIAPKTSRHTGRVTGC